MASTAALSAPPTTSSDAATATHDFPADIKRRKLRVAIVTENFLPKVDGVTRTLARLLEHMNAEGHEAIVFGPETGLTSYSSYPVVGTFGVPLVIYPGLKLNFMRPRFIRRLQQFKPDVVHFVDPIWLGAQMLPAVQKWMPEVALVSSYHTNLPTYATLFGLPWLENTMWRLTRNLHDRCEINFCPSESTARMLRSKGFSNVEIWGRGVYPEMFSPEHRDDNLRASWGATPKPESLMRTPHALVADDAAALQFAHKLGINLSASTSSSSSSGGLLASPSEDSFLRSPPSFALNPNSPSLAASPEFSPPPAYDSLAGIPPLPSGSFALPPPAMSESHDSASTTTDATTKPTARVSARPILSTADQESKTVILYVGRISWEKNLRFLVEAFRLLPDPVRAAAKLVFVGDGPARGDLTRLCQKFGLDAVFMGHQSGKRLAAMYASASVFAFPSFTETFGQVVLEALASGLPVVGLHAEGTSDLVYHGRTGLLLDVAAASKGTIFKAEKELAAEDATAAPSAAEQEADATRDAKAEAAASSDAATAATAAASKITNPSTPGLQTPIPSIVEFSHLTSTSHPAFAHCARAYATLLEQLIADRVTRAEMGRRAREMACKRTWWAAMEECIRGYEHVLRVQAERAEAAAAKAKAAAVPAPRRRLTDEELERVRERERTAAAPLTGPIVKGAVFVYLICFLALWYFVLLA